MKSSEVERPPVTLVVPNYNGKNLLAKNLPEVLKAAAHYPGKATIIVVDDGSSEKGTKELVQNFKSIVYVQHEHNQGFSCAILTGVKNSETEFVFLLNSDVSPSVDFIEPLVDALQDDAVFAASPLIYNEDGSVNKYSWNHYSWIGVNLVRKKWTIEKLQEYQNKRPIRHLFCSGGSVLIRKSRFLLLAGFADIYKPYYSEDLDLGVRAWRRGWHSVFEPKSSVIHQQEGSIRTQEKSDFVKTIQRRNTFYFEWSHLSVYRLLCFRSLFWLRQIIGRALKGDKIYLKGLKLALMNIRSVRTRRTAIENNSQAMTFDELIAQLNEDRNSQR
tara:strand:+ start:79 stop:1068 length:990 start_codon:yes stop_codon:yes gene_type:complete